MKFQLKKLIMSGILLASVGTRNAEKKQAASTDKSRKYWKEAGSWLQSQSEEARQRHCAPTTETRCTTAMFAE